MFHAHNVPPKKLKPVKALGARLTSVRSSSSVPDSTIFSPALKVIPLGHAAHTWDGDYGKFVCILYLDDISYWASGNRTIELHGTPSANLGTEHWVPATCGFINCPPEEWVISDPSPTYAAVLDRMAGVAHAVAQNVPATVIDISTIYQNPDARTLAMVMNGSSHYYFSNAYLGGISITVDGKPLPLEPYTLNGN
jgi:hypothetical protein